MGATVKCFALYDRPFWREAGFSGEAVCTEGPVAVSFDAVSASGQAALLAFVVGAPARGWTSRPAEERKAIVLGSLVRFFGQEAAEPVGYHEVDWAEERWTRGAPIVNFPPGTLSVFGEALRAPVGPIHWAPSSKAAPRCWRVSTRPPTRSRASSMRTSQPAS